MFVHVTTMNSRSTQVA